MKVREQSPGKFLHIKNLPPGSGGGKARGLKFLHDLGLPVPEALVLLEDLEKDNEAQEIYSLLETDNLAVRSSSMDEDRESFSGAGQYESKLNISSPSQLVEAVQYCRYSGFSTRVRTYNKNQGISPEMEEQAIPVIIQKMIQPSVAGVIFTADPLTGSRGHMVLEAAPGSGENVVDGNSKTTSYIIDRNRKKILVSGEPLISEYLLEELKTGAEKAEKAAGRPLDMEWAIDLQNKLWWLQSRPITTLKPEMLDSTITDDNWILSTGNIGEVFPGSITPLTFTTAGVALDKGMQQMYREVGVPIKGNRQEHFIHYFDNHLFFFMNHIWSMIPYVAGSTYDQVDMSICGKPVEERGNLPGNKNVVNRTVNLFRYMNLLLHPDRFLKEMNKLSHNFSIRSYNEPAQINDLYKELLFKQETLNHMYYLHYAVSGHSALMNIFLQKTIKDENKFLTYMAEIPQIESALIPAALNEIAREILLTEDNMTFMAGNTEQQLQWIDDHEKIRKSWNAFFKDHGHRSIKELEMREKEWSADKQVILSNLTGIIRNYQFGRKVENKHEGLALKNLPRAVKKAHEGVRKRERSKSLLVRFQNNFKKGWRNLADLLFLDNKLQLRDLLYFLTADEIGRLIHMSHKRQIEDLNSLALKRRERFIQNDLLHFPLVSKGRPLPLSHSDPLKKGKRLEGIAVSRGFYTGKIRVVKTTEDADSIEQGEIMVSTFTDIGWSPYYSLCGALITELGSPLSHGAVVAREFGIPLVSSVHGATALLQTGDMVSVNGTAGYIEIREETE